MEAVVGKLFRVMTGKRTKMKGSRYKSREDPKMGKGSACWISELGKGDYRKKNSSGGR